MCVCVCVCVCDLIFWLVRTVLFVKWNVVVFVFVAGRPWVSTRLNILYLFSVWFSLFAYAHRRKHGWKSEETKHLVFRLSKVGRDAFHKSTPTWWLRLCIGINDFAAFFLFPLHYLLTRTRSIEFWGSKLVSKQVSLIWRHQSREKRRNSAGWCSSNSLPYRRRRFIAITADFPSSFKNSYFLIVIPDSWPLDWHRYSGPCSNVSFLGHSKNLCLLAYIYITIDNIVIFKVTGPKLTKFLYNVAVSLPFNFMKLELRFRISFWMPVPRVRVVSAK